MGIFTQPPVKPLPTGTNFRGKTIIVTGASAGLGLETARQLLILNASTVVLAVRNLPKGEKCKASLLADPGVKKNNSSPIVKVMKLDMDDYNSVLSFVKAVEAEVPIVDHLLLNAGAGKLDYEVSASGHERTMQVYYLSNVLLVLGLLPHLETGSTKTGTRSIITWLGSRLHHRSSLSDRKKGVKPNETVLGHMDDPKYFFPFQKYNDTKLLCVMFLYGLAPRLDMTKVLINMVCPGMVNTSAGDILPLYLRIPFNVVKAIHARSVQEGARLILNAMAIVGVESHGRFIADKDIQSYVIPLRAPLLSLLINNREKRRAPFLQTDAGQKIERRLYRESISEMSKYLTISSEWYQNYRFYQ
ncbi:hypothetical protein ACLMJK_003256 [Lecanora helva]